MPAMILLRRLAYASSSLNHRCRGIQSGSPASGGSTWTQGEQERLVRLINAEYRGKVSGDWDTVVQQLLETPPNYRRQWTAAERAQLSAHIKAKYLAAGRTVDWDRVGRAFGRTVNAIKNVRYVRTRQQKEDDKRRVAMEAVAVAQVSAADAQALAAAISACHDEHHAADVPTNVDWDTVAKHLQRPLLDTLALAHTASSHIPTLSYLRTTAQPKFPNDWPVSRILHLLAFIRTHYPDGNASVDWNLAALYMHADSLDCVQAVQHSLLTDPAATGHGASRRQSRWQADEIALLSTAVSDAQASQQRVHWGQIAQVLGGKRSPSACISAWRRVEAAQRERQHPAVWTPAELSQLESILASLAPYERPMSQLLKALPDKTADQVQQQLHRTRSRVNIKKAHQGIQHKLRNLRSVAEKFVGSDGLVDWCKVSSEIGLPPNLCESKYEALVVRSIATASGKAHVYWSPAEVARLKAALSKRKDSSGHVNWRAVALLVGSRTATQCCAKYHHLKKHEM
ncbi:hypothetical protein GGI20_002009 [Coemansia sp. BCRC 34301]|nr:hypothetical protein GGI20_002009 [Coemansia sp. BCRC 34301]